jgi:hypothetical protein
MSTKLYYRNWLNPEGSAYLIVNAEAADNWVYAELEIKDCTRQVSLDFGFSNKDADGRQQRLDKIDHLVAQLNGLRAWIESQPKLEEKS